MTSISYPHVGFFQRFQDKIGILKDDLRAAHFMHIKLKQSLFRFLFLFFFIFERRGVQLSKIHTLDTPILTAI